MNQDQNTITSNLTGDLRQSAHPTTPEADAIYTKLRASLVNVFTRLIEKEDRTFMTSKEGYSLDSLLAIFPEEVRPHYNCHVCRSLFERIGRLATYDDEGQPQFVMGQALAEAGIEDPVKPAWKHSAVVSDLIVSQLNETLSITEKGGFEHFYACSDATREVYNSKHYHNPDNFLVLKIIERMSAIRFDSSLVRKAHDIVSPNLHMENTIGLLLPYADFIDRVNVSREKGESVTAIVAIAISRRDHQWLTQMESSNAGNVLDMLRDGEINEWSLRSVIDLINTNTSPEKYKQMTADAPAQAVVEAVEFLREKNWARAIERRLALMNEVRVFWQKPSVQRSEKPEPADALAMASGKLLSERGENKPKGLDALDSAASRISRSPKGISLEALKQKIATAKEVKILVKQCNHRPFIMTAPVSDTEDYRGLFNNHHVTDNPAVHFLTLTETVSPSTVLSAYELESDEVDIVAFIHSANEMIDAVIHGAAKHFIERFAKNNGSMVIPATIAMEHYRHARSIFQMALQVPIQGHTHPDAVGGLSIGIGMHLRITDVNGSVVTYQITSND